MVIIHPPKAFIPQLLKGLRQQWPKTLCEVNHRNAYELMVGVILSAQSTDKGVNEVTPALFKRYPNPQALAKADALDVEKMILRTGFFRAKTRSIQAACSVVVDKFGGKIPATMDELLELPGIGRKSANVILGAIWGIPSGIVVDTHMMRLARRFHLTKLEDPVKIESELVEIVPKKDWIYFSQSMVLHGRYICVAKVPRCWACALRKICPYADKVLAPRSEKDEPPAKTITGLPIKIFR